MDAFSEVLSAVNLFAPIGAGGTGEVSSARDRRLNRDVALKVLPADRTGDPERIRRFHQEARAASALNHPHIVSTTPVMPAASISL